MSCIEFVVPGRPMPAVRMTRRGKWVKDRAQKYLAYKDGLAKLTELFATKPTLSSVASHDVAKAAEEGKALVAERAKTKPAPKVRKPKPVKPKEPQHKCVGCEWARPLVRSGSQVLCIWPTGCEREEGPC